MIIITLEKSYGISHRQLFQLPLEKKETSSIYNDLIKLMYTNVVIHDKCDWECDNNFLIIAGLQHSLAFIYFSFIVKQTHLSYLT